jgi:hypothetical protein
MPLGGRVEQMCDSVKRIFMLVIVIVFGRSKGNGHGGQVGQVVDYGNGHGGPELQLRFVEHDHEHDHDQDSAADESQARELGNIHMHKWRKPPLSETTPEE